MKTKQLEKLKKINGFGVDITSNDKVYTKINEIIDDLENWKESILRWQDKVIKYREEQTGNKK